MINNALFTSNSDEWATPQDTFDQLNCEFHFDLDPCATADNHKTDLYFTAEQDGLNQNWGDTGYSAILHIAR
jgi:site-specific DNA-methyltransferase (adenine-specific)